MATRSPGSTTRPRARVVNDLLDSRWLRGLIFLLFLIAAFYVLSVTWTFLGGFLGGFADTLILFFLAWLLAFMLRPLAMRLQGRKLPGSRGRTISPGLAAGLAFLTFILGLVLVFLLIVPQLVEQVTNAGKYFQGTQFTKDLASWQTWGEAQLKSRGIGADSLNQFTSGLTNSAVDVGKGVLGFVAGLGGVLANVIILLILAFIFMSDGDRIGSSILGVVPMRFREQVRLLSNSIEVSFGGFVRGQFLLGVIFGAVVMSLGLVFQLPYALLAAIVSAIFMLVPLIGYVAAYFPLVLVTLVSNDPSRWWIVLIIVALIQAVIVNVVSPRIMSQSLGIHPLVFFLALLVGSKVGGVWGALFGVPIAGVLNVMGTQLFNSFIKDSRWFSQPPQGWQRVEGYEEDEEEIATEEVSDPDWPGTPAKVTVTASPGDRVKFQLEPALSSAGGGYNPTGQVTITNSTASDVSVNVSPSSQSLPAK